MSVRFTRSASIYNIPNSIPIIREFVELIGTQVFCFLNCCGFHQGKSESDLYQNADQNSKFERNQFIIVQMHASIKASKQSVKQHLFSLTINVSISNEIMLSNLNVFNTRSYFILISSDMHEKINSTDFAFYWHWHPQLQSRPLKVVSNGMKL